MVVATIAVVQFVQFTGVVCGTTGGGGGGGGGVAAGAGVVSDDAWQDMHLIPSRDTCRSPQDMQEKGPVVPAIRDVGGHTQSVPSASGFVPAGQVLHASAFALKI